ncbi:hypothetical protein PVAP13_3KG572150 [Panicum virgatum]|uniref:CCHC-type domain-containing protein n=1 Tax=Panicum virgatum TaxID=38727 RepID=A0A8T0V923_PANVG|nr:hypothetical protein PVAP13_3KG572150 [Panicum virgatum]
MTTLPPPPPPPLPFPDVTIHPSSPPPSFTPDPAATSPPPTLLTSGTPPCSVTGRRKNLRWCQDTPPSGKSGGGVSPLSFRDVLLAAIPSSAAVAASPVPPVKSHGAAVSPRIVLKDVPVRPPSPRVGPDEAGWCTAVSRHTRKELRRLECRPRRPVPVDLHGRCFNCFSSRHRAAACRSSTRCFRCREAGHRSYDCPARRTPPAARSRPVLAWRPVVATSAMRPSDGTSSVPAAGGAGSGRRRRQTRAKRRNRDNSTSATPPNPGSSGDSPASLSSDVDRQSSDASHPPRPRCVITHSNTISRREEDLAGRALVLSVIADNPGGLADSIIPELAHRFEIEEGLLSIQPLGPASYLLISPDEHLATRIYNGGRPLSIPPGCLHVMRWSRFLGSSAARFPHAAEIELLGIPAHAWDLETASQILGSCCVPCGIHPDTAVQRDVFRLAVHCSDPSSVPPAIDLVIPEPAMAFVDGDQSQHALSYPVQVRVAAFGAPVEDDQLPPPPPSAGGDQGHRRRWKRRTHSHRIRGRCLVPRPGNVVPIRGSGSKRVSVPFKVGSCPGLKGVAAPLLADLIGIRRLSIVD